MWFEVRGRVRGFGFDVRWFEGATVHSFAPSNLRTRTVAPSNHRTLEPLSAIRIGYGTIVLVRSTDFCAPSISESA